MKNINKISYFNNEESIVEYINKRHKVDPKGITGIVAGHFMLGYEHTKKELVPLIKEEKNALQGFSELVAKNFPLRSFKIGVRFVQALRHIGIEAKILLLVNDHRFQDATFQGGIEEHIKDKTGGLRKAYYRHTNSIPRTYQKILLKNGLDIKDVLLENGNEKRLSTEILPPETYLFSEHILQKRFRKHTIDQYVKDGLFYETGSEQQKNVLYKSEKQNADYCIVGYGHIGCIGIAIELLLEIVKKGINDIILIIPNECAMQTSQAAEVCLRLSGKKMRVTVINNIENTDENIIVSEYEKCISI